MTGNEDAISQALSRGHVVDITTTGRSTGDSRRIEIVFHNIDGKLYISGMPRPNRRSWLANLEANPRFTFHLKGAVTADLPAMARIIDQDAERRQVLPHIARAWKRDDLGTMIEYSPLVEVTFEDSAN